MTVLNNPAGFLLSGASGNSTGTGVDCRYVANFAFLHYTNRGGESAIFDLQAAPEGTYWNTFASFTATNSGTGTAQYSSYYPYVRAIARSVFSGSNHTGILNVYWQPGLSR